MMSNYKVSIIIPVYNSEKFIKASFESVKKQTFNFEDMEIIFVNDKSTDESLEILKEFQKENDNIFIYTTPEGKKGPGVARNLGLIQATADYVVFFDSDDIMNPEYIETIYEEITTSNVDLVKTAFSVNNGDFVIPFTQNLGKVEVSHSDVSILMDFLFLEPWCTIYNRKYLVKNNIRFISEFNIHESFLFTVESIAKAKNGIVLLDNLQGQIWNLRDDGLHNTTLKEVDFEYTMHCLSEMLVKLIREDQPVQCVEKLTSFILTLWAYDLFTSPEPMEVINGFTFSKGFKADPDVVTALFS